MEFNEKLQELRKSRGLTQEELAAGLYVSRTAVSKWESGRGYPSIDSLKAISQFFSVSLDELLSGDALLTVAEADNRQQQDRLRGLVWGLFDCGAALLLFLPFFGEKTDDLISGVSLLNLSGVGAYVKTPFLIVTCAMMLWGLLILMLRYDGGRRWQTLKYKISLGLSAAGVLLFMIGRQPYAAILLFVFLLIKALTLIKWA
ncbi:MAG: helix-turn-helix domain-containing protein [Firmicutes bacterium]|nr:helix-turn-helix domain-containing protein [Bacillota bacterium]